MFGETTIWDGLFRNSETVFWFFLGLSIVVPFVTGAVVKICAMAIRHRERMAMIEHGIHPDSVQKNDPKTVRSS